MADGVNERFDFSAPLPDIQLLQHAHFIAIGGSGMSGVARLFLAEGVQVSGSDNVDVPVLDQLRAAGAQVEVGYRAANVAQLPQDALVIVSSAIKEDNPELQAVRERGLPVLHRSQGLAMVMAGKNGIAVAGANGKTTTSGMVAHTLRAAGADPSFAIGAPISGIGANSGVGAGNEFVVEADESDGSFVVYHPRVAIVTNIKDDHLDFYGNSERLHAAYRKFVDTIAPDGLLVACADDPGSADLATYARQVGVRALTYGHAPEADLRIEDARGAGFDWRATLVETNGRRHELVLGVPGVHNLLNAAGVALAVSESTAIPVEGAVAGLASFGGTSRRFEVRGEQGGVRVVDDYAHNPGKLDALVRTGLSMREGGRLIVVFQPHLYSRTLNAADGLAEALDLADLAVVLDIYGAREAPVEGVTGQLLVDRMKNGNGIYAPTHSDALNTVLERVRPGDLVITVGAGDVTRLGPMILEGLKANV